MLNHVLLHQTVIGVESKEQMTLAGDEPDVVIGCFGGGSNFGGIALPVPSESSRARTTRFVAVEPSACPTLTRGAYRYDFGDTAKLTPLMPMYTLGHDFVPPPESTRAGCAITATSPLVSDLRQGGARSRRAPTGSNRVSRRR